MNGSVKEKLDQSTVLSRLSAHLDRLSCQIYDVEEALGKIWAEPGAGAGASASVTRLQSLDYVRQSLEDCALLVHYLGKTSHVNELSNECAGDLRGRLKLNTTQNLVIPFNSPKSSGQNADTGGVELF